MPRSARLSRSGGLGRPGILLVGGSSEIGLAIVEAIAGEVASVVLAGRPTSALEAAEGRLRAQGHAVEVMPYYAAWTAQQSARMLVTAEATIGRLDYVIIAVGKLDDGAHDGAGRGGPAGTRTPAEPQLARLLQTNLVGPALVANEAVDLLGRRGHGTLVVVTSAAAVRPRDRILGYAVAKQALDSLVLGLGRRARAHGVRCLVVRPGQVRTRMTSGRPDVPFTTGPDHVAARVRRGLGRRSGVVWSPAPMSVVTALVRSAPAWVLPKELR